MQVTRLHLEGNLRLHGREFSQWCRLCSRKPVAGLGVCVAGTLHFEKVEECQ